MKIIQSSWNGLACYKVAEWDAAGFEHGFLDGGRDFPLESHGGSLNGASLLLLKQVHGAGLMTISSDAPNRCVPKEPPQEADGWVIDAACNRSGFVFGIRTADCVPVIMRAADGRFAALVHCGWRGIAAGIFCKAVARLRELAGEEARIEAAFGPAAGSCCYEISAELASELAKLTDSRAFLSKQNGKCHCDLRALLAHQAAGLRLTPDCLVDSQLCTICSARFFSYRRQKELSGRQLTFVSPCF